MDEQGQHSNNAMYVALWERKMMKPLPLSRRRRRKEFSVYLDESQKNKNSLGGGGGKDMLN